MWNRLLFPSLPKALRHVLASDTPYIRSTFNASQRFFSTGSCPFKVLQVSRGSTYAEAKKSFLKVAMHHHPDTIQQRLDPDDEHYEETLKKSVDKFMTARKAFEGLVEGDDGVCLLRSDVEIVEELQMTDEQFDAWFMSETGHNNPYQFDIDPETMREVAEATESMGGGLDRDGGMWTLASMVSNSVKSGKGGGNPLRLEAGEIKKGGQNETNLEGSLRRRRRPGRRF